MFNYNKNLLMKGIGAGETVWWADVTTVDTTSVVDVSNLNSEEQAALQERKAKGKEDIHEETHESLDVEAYIVASYNLIRRGLKNTIDFYDAGWYGMVKQDIENAFSTAFKKELSSLKASKNEIKPQEALIKAAEKAAKAAAEKAVEIDATEAEKRAFNEIRKAKVNELIIKYRKNENKYSTNSNLSKEFSRLISPKKIEMDELTKFESAMTDFDGKVAEKEQQDAADKAAAEQAAAEQAAVEQAAAEKETISEDAKDYIDSLFPDLKNKKYAISSKRAYKYKNGEINPSINLADAMSDKIFKGKKQREMTGDEITYYNTKVDEWNTKMQEARKDRDQARAKKWKENWDNVKDLFWFWDEKEVTTKEKVENLDLKFEKAFQARLEKNFGPLVKDINADYTPKNIKDILHTKSNNSAALTQALKVDGEERTYSTAQMKRWNELANKSNELYRKQHIVNASQWTTDAHEAAIQAAQKSEAGKDFDFGEMWDNLTSSSNEKTDKLKRTFQDKLVADFKWMDDPKKYPKYKKELTFKVDSNWQAHGTVPRIWWKPMNVEQRDKYNAEVRKWNDKRREAADKALEKALWA